MNKCQVILSIVVIVFLRPVTFAQSFAPEPEEIGSDAIHKIPQYLLPGPITS